MARSRCEEEVTTRGRGRVREFALGLEGLERSVAAETLRRVHECVFAVPALESEPVDPPALTFVAALGQGGDRFFHAVRGQCEHAVGLGVVG
ncbi:MAG: hypothetical protein QGH25_04105 [Candidatus Latescibacteria bacterium]|nr:hypothetical protein [Candidatus Latescibacterota bacterium]